MSVLDSISRFYASSIGKKIVVAVTGILLVFFLVGHLTGNLLVYVGADAVNAYAKFLHEMLHGWGVWIARIGLLVAFGVHIFTTVGLVRQNREARKSRYQYDATVQASSSSRIMIWSGLTILAFVIYHLLHFTVRAFNDFGSEAYIDAEGRHDVYKMIIDGFSFWPASLFYVISMALLFSHLGHGVASTFQTLGFATDKNWKFVKTSCNALSLALFLGFTSIPVAVLFKVIT
ncbi:MAG: succinate dehydrogenase cytochrome b subunit [Verrucomicrobiales bacterium]|nr:succinate dehydrogenase cytochrome b subunit [Verrucomicrobiales bacterium]